MVFAIGIWLALFFAQQTPLTPPPVGPQTASAQSVPAKPPCRNPDADGKYRIGCGVTAPMLIQNAEPKFPGSVGKLHKPLYALAHFTVDTEGVPQDVQIIKSSSSSVSDKNLATEIDKAFLESIKSYRFKPAKFQGKAVPVEMNVEANIDIF